MISVTAILRKLKQQSRESVEDKRPKLLKALREVRTTLRRFSLTPVCCHVSFQLFIALLFPPCSWETFIWSCTGTFRAGVSFHTSHRINHLFILAGSLSSFPAHIDSYSFLSSHQCLCCPGCCHQTLVKSTSKELTSGKMSSAVIKWS